MTMSKQDYELIAEVLARFGPAANPDYEEYTGGEKGQRMRRMVGRGLADRLASDNPQFDRDRFLEAARVST